MKERLRGSERVKEMGIQKVWVKKGENEYIDGSCAVSRVSLSYRGSQMNRFRLIDEVSIY